ncbi:MAG: hypothetical protein P9L88_03260 [Candidatus Tantalella remota]|nr:hypothetical protein [Candidatus Tantalella remota]
MKKRDRMKGSMNEIVVTDRILAIVSLILFCVLIVLMFKYYVVRPSSTKAKGSSSKMDMKKAVKKKWDSFSEDEQESWKDYLDEEE